MRAVASLRRLDRIALRKLGRLERRAGRLVFGASGDGTALSTHLIESELSILTINLQTFWSNWCRTFYISCAIGTRAIGGTQITSTLGFQTQYHAMAKAIQVNKGTKSPPSAWRSYDEPKWFDPSVLLSIAHGCALTNAGQMSAVLGTVPAAFGDLRILRNYFAHRSEELRQEALNVGPSYLFGARGNPSSLLVHMEQGHTSSVLERWIIVIRRTAHALCQ